MSSFDHTVDIERALLKVLTSSAMMARMYLHRASEALFTTYERKFIFECAKKVLDDSRTLLTRTVYEYEVSSCVSAEDAAYYLSEWNLIEGLQVEEPPEVLVNKLQDANVGRKTLSLAEEVVGMLEGGRISDAVQYLKRESMLLEGKKDEKPIVELTDYQHRIDLISDKRANPEKYLGIKTGFETYDRITGGIYKGEMVLIAGITGLGKSTMCKQLAKNIVTLNSGKNVLHIANEEYLEQVEHKYDAVWSGVPYDDFKKATISDEDMQRWTEQMMDVKSKFGRIFVKEVPAFTDVTLVERAYRELENLGIKIDVVIIDHLPHVIPVAKAWGENDERAKAASECKELARWLHVAVLIPSQAATEVEEKSNKGRRAGKLDVYGSKGQIHVANVFMIITAKGTDDTQTERKDYQRDMYWMVDIKKNRDGPPFFFFARHRVLVGRVEEIKEEEMGQSAAGRKDAEKAVEEVVGKAVGKDVGPKKNPQMDSFQTLEAIETGGASLEDDSEAPKVPDIVSEAAADAAKTYEESSVVEKPKSTNEVAKRAIAKLKAEKSVSG